jgi:hypothetical protein
VLLLVLHHILLRVLSPKAASRLVYVCLCLYYTGDSYVSYFFDRGIVSKSARHTNRGLRSSIRISEP